MRVRIQLVNPSNPIGSDRRRLLVLLRYFRRWGIDADLYSPGAPFDVLIVGQTLHYSRWLPIARAARDEGKAYIQDVTNDVFSGLRSFAVRSNFRGLGHVAWYALGARWALLRLLRAGNVGKAAEYWRSCSAIVTGSRIQARKYLRFNSRVFYHVDSVDPVEYTGTAQHTQRRPLVLAWEGTAENLVYFVPFLDQFRPLIAAGDFSLRIVTDRYRSAPYRGTVDNLELLKSWRLPAEFVEWNIGSFSRHLAASDIGIAPLPLDDPFSSAKPENKILGYAFLGLPVVASPIPSYRDAISRGGFGFVANDAGTWCDYLERLARDPRLREAMGAAGRRYVQNNASPEVFAQRYLSFVRSCLANTQAPDLEPTVAGLGA